MIQGKMYIGGEWVDAKSGGTVTTYNPATGEPFGTAPAATEEDVDAAVKAARDAFEGWHRMPQNERSNALFCAAEAIKNRAEELALIESKEHGTPFKDAFGAALGAAEKFKWSAGAGHRVMGEQIPVDGTTFTFIQRHPVGVVGFIVPWNLPVIMTAVKLAPALAVGNTCVLKPPTINSLSVLKLAEILSDAEVFPKGVVNFVTGSGGTAGTAIARHPDVDMIGFTGSTETGKRLLHDTADTVKKCVMELGGNNPVIVMADANISDALDVLAWRQFNNSGQHCSGPGRYYVHEEIYDAFLTEYKKRAEAVVMGNPEDRSVTMGPVVSAEHQAHVMDYIEGAVKDGARIVAGGSAVTPGFFVQPTVIADVKHSMRIAREEVFGPVAVVIKYTDRDDIVKLANDSRYGLCAHIWSGDIAKGMRLVEKIQAGAVFVNTQMLTDEQSWGTSVKESGIGKEGGLRGMLEFTDQKLVCVKYA